ncbi:MAG: two-component system response regulator [Chloroflexaceae bacterium]
MTRPLIMVIDESVVILEFMQVLLNSEGYIVISCYPGETNIAYARHLRPNMTIVEVQQENLDHTIAFIKEIRTDPVTSTFPMMVMSTDSDLLKTIDPLLRQYTCIAVEKPFSADWFLETIRQLISTPITQEQYDRLAYGNHTLV